VPVAFEQLGDAEVQELDAAVFRHQDVRSFKSRCRMSGMCMRHRAEDLQEQSYAGLDPETLRVAPDIDRLAFDILEHEIGLVPRRRLRRSGE
jgi:hypothetical protein